MREIKWSTRETDLISHNDESRTQSLCSKIFISSTLSHPSLFLFIHSCPTQIQFNNWVPMGKCKWNFSHSLWIVFPDLGIWELFKEHMLMHHSMGCLRHCQRFVSVSWLSLSCLNWLWLDHTVQTEIYLSQLSCQRAD